MAKCVNFFKLLEENSTQVSLSIPPSIILGNGFACCTLLSTKNGFNSIEMERTAIPRVVQEWGTFPHCIVKTQSGNTVCYDLDQLDLLLTENCVIQKVIKGARRMVISWNSFTGVHYSYGNSAKDTSFNRKYNTFHERKSLKDLIALVNKTLKHSSFRLESAQFEGLLTANTVYFLGILSYRFSLSPEHPESPLPKLQTTKTSASTTQLRTSKQTKPTAQVRYRSLNEDVKQFFTHRPSLKHLRLTTIQHKLESGERLLPNEIQYQKVLASIASEPLLNKNRKQFRRMVTSLGRRNGHLGIIDVGEQQLRSQVTQLKLHQNQAREEQLKKEEYYGGLVKLAEKKARQMLDNASAQLDAFKHPALGGN